MRVLSLFSGIGAHDLGLEWAGMKIVGQVEIDDYCQTILKKHWPKVKRWTDITTVPINDLRRLKPDLITGGFPCQDISVAGKQKGIVEGERSSLWREMWRIIRAVRPTWLLLENVPALRTNGADTVIAALEAIGYTCWPLVVGARHVGAPHRRDRIWIVAHHVRTRQYRRIGQGQRRLRTGDSGKAPREDAGRQGAIESMGNSEETRLQTGGVSSGNEKECAGFIHSSLDVPDANSDGIRLESGWSTGASGAKASFAFPSRPGEQQYEWESPRIIESGLGGTTARAAGGLDKNKRLKALGNANPPQVVAMIGRAIMQADSSFI